MNNETMFDLEHLQRFLDNPEQFTIKQTTMHNNKLQNKQQLTAAVKGVNYVIGSFTETQGLSFSNFPAVHYSPQAARAECKRLAAQNPNKTYVFVQLLGGEETVSQPRFISI
jgi:hypothetical protein